MAKSKTVAEPTPPPVEPQLDSMLQSLDEVVGSNPDPRMTDPGWCDFVMSHFDESELDKDGCPRVHGLRRVARLLIGPVLRSWAEVVQPPSWTSAKDHNNNFMMNPAVARHELVVLQTRDVPGDGIRVEFAEVADVWVGNADPKFWVYMSALAATRAEARNLRKALQLNKVSAEEKGTSDNGSTSAFSADFIQPAQKTMIVTKCSQLNVNVRKFINAGKSRYAKLKDVPYEVAIEMVRAISSYQQNPGKIPPAILGFDPNYKNEIGD